MSPTFVYSSLYKIVPTEAHVHDISLDELIERHILMSLKEVRDEGAGGNHVGLVGDGVEDLELLVVVLVHLENRRLVSASIKLYKYTI